jgi:guanylate kinase
MSRGVLLYGPPAAGKDTVTAALAALDPRYVPFTRLKIGSGRTRGYRMGTPEQLKELEERSEVLYRNDRYGNTYVVDRPGLHDMTRGSRIPVIHLGQIAGIQAVAEGFPARWQRVLLWCPREITQQRSAERGDGDTPARLTAWDATERDVAAYPEATWELTVHTDAVAPQEAALQIHALIRAED